MHHASFNGALIAKPSWGLIGELTLDGDGMRRLHEEKELVLGTQGNAYTLTPWSNHTDTFLPLGSICDCGKRARGISSPFTGH